jgi:agmatinase
MNVPIEYSDKKKSKVIIIPISYDVPLAHGIGASKAPNAILKASANVDYFDLELNKEPYVQGIYTQDVFALKEKEFPKVSPKIVDYLSILKLTKDKFPIIIGSDHSNTIPIVCAFEETYSKEDFGIIVFDSHPDVYEPWGKDTWWQACSTRIISNTHKSMIVGVRTMDFYENEFLKSKRNKNISIIKMQDFLDNTSTFYDLSKNKKFISELKNMPKNIYLSIDVDVFDPSVIRNTAALEPGGMNYNQLLSLLRVIFKEKNVIGADIVEFTPTGNEDYYFPEAYTLAKLIYKLVGYKYYL